MKQLLVEKRFHFGTLASGTPAAPHEKTLQDVHTHEQFFYWLKAPFLDALFVPEPGGEPLFLHGYNRVIGPARLRQVHPGGGQCLQYLCDSTVEVELRDALLPYPMHEQRQPLSARATHRRGRRRGTQLGQHLVHRVKQGPSVHRLGAGEHCRRIVLQPVGLVRKEGLLAQARGEAVFPGRGNEGGDHAFRSSWQVRELIV